MVDSSIHIILASDDNYVQHLGVLLVSIFENNTEPIVVHILSDAISASNRGILQQLVSQYNQQVCFYDMDKALFADFPIRVRDHITLATYYRLRITDILPSSLHKILY